MTDRPIRFVDKPVPTDPVPVLDADGAMEVLRLAKRIAVVGASPNRWRASNSVMGYLLAHGYECVPINPNQPTVLEQPCFPTLEEAVVGSGGAPFDIVDVFRRPEYAPDIARSAVALGCGNLWLQQRVISWEAAQIAHDGGLSVVMDRCSAIEHRRLHSLRS